MTIRRFPASGIPDRGTAARVDGRGRVQVAIGPELNDRASRSRPPKCILPTEAGGVAMPGEVSRRLSLVLGKYDPVVAPGGAMVRLLPGEQAHAGRGADRRGAVGPLKMVGLAREPVEIRRPHPLVARESRHGRGVLVAQQQQDVRGGGLRRSPRSARLSHGPEPGIEP